jgi:hypothetical protein
MTLSIVSCAMSQQKLMTLLQRSSSRTISQLWAHGNAESAKQSMDKDTLLVSLITVMVILSMWMGYIMGIKNG